MAKITICWRWKNGQRGKKTEVVTNDIANDPIAYADWVTKMIATWVPLGAKFTGAEKEI